MNSKTTANLFVCLILSVSQLSLVHAVTDEELEALEKQIEQQEAEEIKRIEAAEKKKAEAKRKAEQQRKANAEVKEEAKKRAEAEVMRKVEEEAKKKAETERRFKDEKESNERLKSLITEAESAESSNDYNLAITKYNNVLNEFPNNTESKSNIVRIKSLLDNCESIVGEWIWFNGASMVYNPDGTFVWNLFITGGGTWKCINPGKYEFYMTHTNNSQWDGPIWVVDNGQKLKGKEPNIFGGEYMGERSTFKKNQGETFKGL